ncbi:MAG: Pyrrolo-quinoline quinone repeat-containing protein [Pedosphaera sp.]|nr:Pyrrolo-quinoline quinone repeat-containing protein [Pedosphaera sp.]
MKLTIPIAAGLFGFVLTALSLSADAAPAKGWLNWRGPQQNGTSLETGLPDKVDPQHPLWRADLPGQSTPVIANGKLYIMGYLGEGGGLQEGVVCYDANTGKELWRQLFSDFLSDTVYQRYATSSPTVDDETGNVYIQGTQGILAAFASDGRPLWKHSLMEEYGRLTFPNSRTASPAIDQDLVITRGITANWGKDGPAADRFYAFDKKTGELVWTSSPGDRPKDNSFSHPNFGWLNGKRVFYSATGDGAVVCVNARTGEPIWRVPLTKAGINSTVLLHNNDKVISIFGVPYEPGQLVALKISSAAPTNADSAPVVLNKSEVQMWADDISTSTSSPILVGDRVYVVSEKGELCAVDANKGTILWKLKIGIEERNSSPIYADGKIYIPMLDDPAVKSEGSGESGTKGALYIIKPTDAAGEIIDHVSLEGRCFGTPTAYDGKVYIQTTRYLYCFGKPGHNPGLPAAPAPEKWPAPGPATQLQILPSEVLMRPGQIESFRVRSLDANGFTVSEVKDVSTVKWASFIPPTAKVKSTMKASFNDHGKLVADPETTPSAGAFMAQLGDLKGFFRGRVLPYLPIKQDFEKFTLTETNLTDNNALFSYPPLPWIGARFKFEIRDLDGNKVLAKTLDNPFFQRATVFIGDASSKDYTIEADIMSDGNKRIMSEVGLVNQRYYIVMKGAFKQLEVNSNQELFRYNVPFVSSPNVWYHLKSRVDVARDGSGVIRAKIWKKGDAEPEAWTLEVSHEHAHENGSPGLFAFAPQKRVYIDNITVTPNK